MADISQHPLAPSLTLVRKSYILTGSSGQKQRGDGRGRQGQGRVTAEDTAPGERAEVEGRPV